MAAGRVPMAEAAANDAFNLLHALQGIAAAANATNRERLMQTIQEMAQALGAELDWQSNGIRLARDAAERYVAMLKHWQTIAREMQPVLSRYLQGQLSQALFPYAGFGDTLSERMAIIGIRLATVKLALMARALLVSGVPSSEDVIRIIQSLSRVLDHLAEPTFSRAIYTETGWLRDARLRGLLGA
jgi:hypothetical protein